MLNKTNTTYESLWSIWRWSGEFTFYSALWHFLFECVLIHARKVDNMNEMKNRMPILKFPSTKSEIKFKWPHILIFKKISHAFLISKSSGVWHKTQKQTINYLIGSHYHSCWIVDKLLNGADEKWKWVCECGVTFIHIAYWTCVRVSVYVFVEFDRVSYQYSEWMHYQYIMH